MGIALTRSLRQTARRLPSLTLVVIFVAVALAACSGGGAKAGLGAGGRQTTTTTPRFFPLTGVQVGDPAFADRPAVTVKIENSAASRPQAGLDQSDVVIEAVVEGGQTRFLAIFHSTNSDPVGPVRSVRPGDPDIVQPFGGMVAYSGGIARFVARMKATSLKNYDENTAGSAFVRRRDKRAPHDLYTSANALYAKGTDGMKPPPKFAEFLKPGEPFANPAATPVTHVDLQIGGSTNAGYDWDVASSTWKRSNDRSPHLMENGAQVAPATVVIQYVSYEDTGEVDTTGASVMEAKVVGSGEAVIFAGGQRLNGRWSKPSATAMTTYTDAAGAPIKLPTGRVWVELPRIGVPLNVR